MNYHPGEGNARLALCLCTACAWSDGQGTALHVPRPGLCPGPRHQQLLGSLAGSSSPPPSPPCPPPARAERGMGSGGSGDEEVGAIGAGLVPVLVSTPLCWAASTIAKQCSRNHRKKTSRKRNKTPTCF